MHHFSGKFQNKPLLMLKCLKQAALLDSSDPRLHVCRVKFLKYSKYDSQFPSSYFCRLMSFFKRKILLHLELSVTWCMK